jgi:hypothetical protein
MSMSRPQWKFLAALGLGLWFQPQPGPAHPLSRVAAERDRRFNVPDSVRSLLSFVTSIVVDSDSSLYLADYQLGMILHLEPSGGFRRVIGRRGSGPGEFNSVINLGLHRDSLWVMDPALVRLTLIPRKGSGALTVPFGSLAANVAASSRPQTRQGLPAAVLPDGSLLIQEAVRDSNSSVGEFSHALLLRASRNLEVMDTLARLSMGHSEMAFLYRDGEAHYGQPFGDDPLYSASADGSLLVTINREASRRGGEDKFTVTAWRNGEQRLYTREITYQPRRLSRSVVDSVVKALAHPQRKDLPVTPITADSLRRHLFRPAYYPPVKEVKVTQDGVVWLRVNFADSPDGLGDWMILSRHGFEFSRVTLPANFRMLEANRHTAWGVEGDELDVPLVTRYQVPDWGN